VRETRRDPANPDAAAAPIAKTAASHIAAPDYEIDGAAFERLQHARQQPLIALKIGIDYRDVGRARSEHAFDASCCETAPADPLKTAHPRVAPSEGTNMFGCAVPRVIVHKYCFPCRIRQGFRQQGN
jgi:hypothetical protein